MGPLVTSGDVPVRDLGGPAADGSTQLVDLGWAGLVLEIARELQGVLESEGRCVDVVDAPHGFLRVPGGAKRRRGGHPRRGGHVAVSGRGR